MSLFYDLSGGVNTELTKVQLGLGSKKISWADSLNVEIYKNRGIARQNGNCVLTKSPDGEAVVGMFEYFAKDFRCLVFNTAAGNFYLYDADFKTVLLKKSGLACTSTVNYARYLDGIIVTNGVDDPFYFEYKASEEVKPCNAMLENGTEIRGLAIAAYKSRLWIASGGTLYFSALGTFDNWKEPEDAGYIRNFHTDSNEITALMPYKDFLAIHKSRATYFLSGNSTSDFAVIPFADKGSVAVKSLRNVDNKQYFFSDGLFNLEQVGELSQVALGDDLASDIRSEIDKFSIAKRNEITIVGYSRKNQLWLFAPSKSSGFINTVWVFDIGNKAWFRREIPLNIVSAASFGADILTATDSGEILKEDFGDYFIDKPIKFYWKSPFFSLGEPNLRKTFDEFYFLVDESVDNNFDFSVFTDYDAQFADAPEQITSGASDNMVWDSDYSFWSNSERDFFWSRHVEAAHRATIWGSNNAVQLCVSGSKPAHNVAIIGLEFKEMLAD